MEVQLGPSFFCCYGRKRAVFDHVDGVWRHSSHVQLRKNYYAWFPYGRNSRKDFSTASL
jgi:hypothetical protein